MAHSSRTWTGARTPQAQKRVRQSERRNAILQPRRSAARTEVKGALLAAESGDAEMTQRAVADAVAALDRAAKVGAIHPNNAARRKSRLMRRANAALGGGTDLSTGKRQRQVSKTTAAKAAKARIAAGKASKAKGEQTAAGKARAALSRSSRAEAPGTASGPEATEPGPTKAAARTSRSTAAARSSGAGTKTTARTTTSKATTKSASSRTSTSQT